MGPAEKLAHLSGATPFWAGMVDIAVAEASHRHPWPAGVLPNQGLVGLQFVDGPRVEFAFHFFSFGVSFVGHGGEGDGDGVVIGRFGHGWQGQQGGEGDGCYGDT
jgi:hypothetical protein